MTYTLGADVIEIASIHFTIIPFRALQLVGQARVDRRVHPHDRPGGEKPVWVREMIRRHDGQASVCA